MGLAQKLEQENLPTGFSFCSWAELIRLTGIPILLKSLGLNGLLFFASAYPE